MAGESPNDDASVDALDAFAEKLSAIVRIRRKRTAGAYDVFLCHNSDDKSEVRALGERLKERGYLPWLDEWALRPGMSWQTDLEEKIREVPSAAIFVGRSGIGPWQDVEVHAILQQFVERGCPAIPVILPSCKQTPKLPLFLKNHTWVDFRVLDPDPLSKLIWGITGKRDEG